MLRGEEQYYPDTRLTPKIFRRQDMTDWDKLELESQIFDEFKRSIYQFAANIPNDDMEVYFLMQHHGAPTRLLDWSNGSLMALHFALRNKQHNDASNAYVYALYSQDFQKTLPTST